MNHSQVISVIVCCYNPDFEKLKKTLLSIEKQDYPHFEVIISDDGSKISYENELKKWVENNGWNNVIYNFLPTNVGTVKNILSACHIAKGEYVKTISPGDFLFDEHSLSDYMDAFLNHSADFVYGKFVYFDLNGNIVRNASPRFRSTFNPDKLKRNLVIFGDMILGAVVAFKRQLVIDYLSDVGNSVRLLEDAPLEILSVINNNHIVFVDKPLVWYEYGSGVSTNPYSIKLIDNEFDSLYQCFYENYGNNKYIMKAKRYRRYNGTKIKKALFFPLYIFLRIKSFFFRPYFYKKIKNINEVAFLKG